MKRVLILAAPLLISVPATAAPGGPLGVLQQGRYACETGGDATGATGVRHPELDFTITRGSSYRMETGKGIYLNTGDRVIFSTGPLEGRTMRRIRENFVRFSEANGTDSDMRCVRRPGSHG